MKAKGAKLNTHNITVNGLVTYYESSQSTEDRY